MKRVASVKQKPTCFQKQGCLNHWDKVKECRGLPWLHKWSLSSKARAARGLLRPAQSAQDPHGSCTCDSSTFSAGAWRCYSPTQGLCTPVGSSPPCTNDASEKPAASLHLR